MSIDSSVAPFLSILKIMTTRMTVATPVYNGMPWIRQCIGSIRGQCGNRVAKDKSVSGQSCLEKDFYTENNRDSIKNKRTSLITSPISIQHIVCDNISTDGTAEYLRDFSRILRERANSASDEAKDPMRREGPMVGRLGKYRFNYVSERDKGMYDAINKAWALSDGDILSWLNADEQYLPNTFIKVVDYFANNPDVDVVFGDFIIISEDDTPIACRREIPLRKTYIVNGTNLYAASCTTFYRRRLYDSGMLKLDTSYRYAADADLVMRLLDARVRFAHIPCYLSVFRSRPGENLSCSNRLNHEMNKIQLSHGRLRTGWLRTIIRCGRYVERIVHGGYRPDKIRIRLAKNDLPEYKWACANNVGSRFANIKTKG